MKPHFPIIVRLQASSGFANIQRSLLSLLASELPDSARVVWLIDWEPHPRLRDFVHDCAARRSCVEIWASPGWGTTHEDEAMSLSRVLKVYPDAPYQVICSDRLTYHPDWLRQLLRVYEDARAEGLQGICTALNLPFWPVCRPIRLPANLVWLKERQPAINWLVPREVYQAVGPFRGGHEPYDTDYLNRLKAFGFPVICLTPSYVCPLGHARASYLSRVRAPAVDYVGCQGWSLRWHHFWQGFRPHAPDRSHQHLARASD